MLNDKIKTNDKGNENVNNGKMMKIRAKIKIVKIVEKIIKVKKTKAKMVVVMRMQMKTHEDGKSKNKKKIKVKIKIRIKIIIIKIISQKQR
jgi:hypothetical protein